MGQRPDASRDHETAGLPEIRGHTHPFPSPYISWGPASSALQTFRRNSQILKAGSLHLPETADSKPEAFWIEGAWVMGTQRTGLTSQGERSIWSKQEEDGRRRKAASQADTRRRTHPMPTTTI